MAFRLRITFERERKFVMRAGGLGQKVSEEKMQLFRTKPIEEILSQAEEEGEGALKRTLGVTALTLLGVGAVIGTGIFVLTGQAAGKHAGPAVVLSMILAGVVSALAALCYSEFAASV
ncbi:MAG TPA: hypothetical protein VHL50_10335, partial [Pyrinomonadaceae bacterium]|nr:hypothetical protein [Pyrinomonadaceae bacterium]